jgi:Ion transport protein
LLHSHGIKVIKLGVQAVPLLASVSGLMLFFLFLFGVVGTQLFAQAYHQACVNVSTGETEIHHIRQGQWGCGGSRTCPANYTCSQIDESPLIHDVAGFDNVGFALLTAFQACPSGAADMQQF